MIDAALQSLAEPLGDADRGLSFGTKEADTPATGTLSTGNGAHFRGREGARNMFEGTHENFERLRRAFAGRAGQFEVERATAHLLGCRPCRLLAARAMAAQQASGPIAVQEPLRSLLDLYEREQANSEEWLEAQATWIEIKSLTVKARRDKVRLTRSLHTLSFLEVVLEEGTAAGSPAESEELFYLALLVAGLLPSSEYSAECRNDLCAECCAEIANARRRLAKWPAVRDALKKGINYAEKGAKDGVAEGKVLCGRATRPRSDRDPRPPSTGQPTRLPSTRFDEPNVAFLRENPQRDI